MGRAPPQPMDIKTGLMMTMMVRTLLACAWVLQACRTPFITGCHQSSKPKQPRQHLPEAACLQRQHGACPHFLGPICGCSLADSRMVGLLYCP